MFTLKTLHTGYFAPLFSVLLLLTFLNRCQKNSNHINVLIHVATVLLHDLF